ncbi:serine-rich adhesin for platelets-like [Sycon ciliatum]|uniref:serine-rich adhesin for platelets-like n=1 Tax=Sycon ciliatum TaxID=27933 RepID=UPI0031F69FFD
MSFRALFKSSKKDGAEGGQSPAQSQKDRVPISVSVPPKPTASMSTHATVSSDAGSMFDGMNFGTVASAVPEQEKAGDASAPEAESSSNIDSHAAEGSSEASTAEASAFTFLKPSTAAAAAAATSAAASQDESGEPSTTEGSAFSFLKGDAAPDNTAVTTETVGVEEPAASSAFSFLSAGSATQTSTEVSIIAPSNPTDSDMMSAAHHTEETAVDSGSSPAALRATAAKATPVQASPTLRQPRSVQRETPSSTTGTPSNPQRKKKRKARVPGGARLDDESTSVSMEKSPSISRSGAGSREDLGDTSSSSSSLIAGKESIADVAGPTTDSTATQVVGVGSASSDSTPASIKKSSASSSVAGSAGTATRGVDTVTDVTPAAADILKDGDETDGQDHSSPKTISKLALVDLDGSSPAVGDQNDHEAKLPVDENVESSDQSVPVDSAASAAGQVSNVPDSLLESKQISSTDQNEVDSMNVYDIKLSVEERLELRLQSESFPLNDILLNLKQTENQLVGYLSTLHSNQAQRLSKRREAPELRKLEAAATAQENFEEAEKHNSQLKDITDTLASMSFTLQSVDNMVSLNSKRNELIESQCSVQRESVDCIQLLLKEQLTEAESYRTQSTADIAKHRQEISLQREAIVREQSHMDVDWDLSRKCTEKLQAEEEEKTRDTMAERGELSKKLDTVQMEIAELEERLRGLRQQASTIQASIDVVDSKVATVRTEMSAQRSQLDTQVESLHEQQAQLDKRKAKLEADEGVTEKLQEEIDTSQKRHADIETKMQSLIESRSHSLEVGRNDTECVESFLCLAEQSRQTLACSISLSEQKGALTEKEDEAQGITHKLVIAQKDTASLRGKLDSITTQLPSVETAKKLAVSGRNFKEAQRLKLEQEKLLVEKASVEKALEEEHEKSGQLNALLKDCQEQLDALRQDYLRIEEESDMEIVSNCTKYSDKLQELLSSGSASAFLQRLVKIELSFCKLVSAELLVKHGKPVDLTEALDFEDSDDFNHAGAGDLDTCARDDQPAATQLTAGEDTEEKKTLRARIEALKDELDDAIAAEDYDKAAKIDEEVLQLNADLEALA